MKELKLPKTIFIVGSAGAGKTSLANRVRNRFPCYTILSDLTELKTLLKKERATHNPHYIKLLVSGGFDIIHPAVWDRALVVTARKIKPKKFYIFEFARGVDVEYMNFLGLRKSQIYDHCFKVILSVQPNISVQEALVIHLGCGFTSRLKRNRKRKEMEQHFVAEEVMYKIYSEDNFCYLPIGSNYGYLNEENKLLVFFVDNSIDLPLAELVNYFDLQIDTALEAYAKYSLK